MSRIGKQPIPIPEGVEVTIDENLVTIKGPKGTQTTNIPKAIQVAKDDKTLLVTKTNATSNEPNALWGTIQRLIKNDIIGVTQGFTKKLEMTGVGYRAHMKGKALVLEVGFSHEVTIDPSEDVTLLVEDNTTIIVSGNNKQRVGQVAADIRAVKKPEPYKGKGIAYEGEIIKRKAGKQAASAEGSGAAA